MKPYERLEAFQFAHRLVLETYAVSQAFPTVERYGLTAQARRAAVSVAANIVEGSTKRGRAEFRRFLDIAMGSLAELGYLLRLARDLGHLADEVHVHCEDLRDRTGRILWGLYRSLR